MERKSLNCKNAVKLTCFFILTHAPYSKRQTLYVEDMKRKSCSRLQSSYIIGVSIVSLKNGKWSCTQSDEMMMCQRYFDRFVQTMTATFAESLFDIKPPTDTTINYVNIVIFLVLFPSITPHTSLSVSAWCYSMLSMWANPQFGTVQWRLWLCSFFIFTQTSYMCVCGLMFRIFRSLACLFVQWDLSPAISVVCGALYAVCKSIHYEWNSG